MSKAYFDRQRLPDLSVIFDRCRSCNYVSMAFDVGRGCQNCGKPAQISLSHFSYDVHALLELIFNASSKEEIEENSNSNQFALVLSFCTLVEVLLHHFLINLMTQKKLNTTIQRRLLSDNLFVKQRIEKLFPALTEESWKSAVNKICANTKLYDYAASVNFYVKDAAPARNRFLHDGDKWAISKKIIDGCILHTRRIICFFVELHNMYIPWQKREHELKGSSQE